MISTKRANEINEYFIEHGESKTSEYYDISTESVNRYVRVATAKKARHPKILLFDLETSPNLSYNWGFWKQNIQHQQIVQPWILISWAGKWLYGKDAFGDVLTVDEAKASDDKRICESLLDVFNKADVVIAHNLKKFDNKRAKTRFFINGLNPPSPYQMIDTLEQFRKEFVMPSNRLDYLLTLLHDDSKLSTEFALWPKCLNWFGHVTEEQQQESLDYMFKYNKKDVYGLEDIYLDIRPWIKSHPNMAVYSESTEECCPNCGSSKLKENGYYFTPAGKFESLTCECGAQSRRRINILTKKEKQNLLIPNAR